MRKMLYSMMTLFLVAACASTQPAQTPPLLPDESVEDVVIEAGEVIFDGTECTFSGPTELPKGKYSFVLKDLSEMDVDLFVRRLTDEKKGYQDLLDLQSEPGEYHPRPDWLIDAMEPGSEEYEPDGGVVHTYLLTKEAEYVIFVFSLIPRILWYCAPLQVIEAPSE